MILNYNSWTRVNEQNEEEKGIIQQQKFLNAKGITGKDLKLFGNH